MRAVDHADRLRSLLERMHRPDATLSATRRRLDLLTQRPQETHRMPDDCLLIELERDGEEWTARVVDRSPTVTRRAVLGLRFRGDSPAWALETLGQELNRREAARLTREARGEAGPVTVEEAVERARARDVARIVEVLETEERRRNSPRGSYAMATSVLADVAGFIAEPRTAAVYRARRALEQAERDGVVKRLDLEGPGELWRLASDDDVEVEREVALDLEDLDELEAGR